MRILFIAPAAANLDTTAELMRITSGNMVELVTGAVDRAGVERALRAAPYDAVHISSHGDKGALYLTDGILDTADFVSMVAEQRNLKFVMVSACNSLSLGTALHNALHIPIIAHDSNIQDKAATRFAETFYRAFKQTKGDVHESFERAKATLLRVYPDQTAIPQLINGDMATVAELTDCMQYIREELGQVFERMNERLDRQDKRLATIEATMTELHKPGRERIIVVGFVLLILAQLITPWLNALFGR